jgi:hypothetical protein
VERRGEKRERVRSECCVCERERKKEREDDR